MRWAFEEASQHGAELVAVTTWTLAPPPIVYPYAGFQPHLEGDIESLARSALEDAVAPLLESGPDVPVQIIAVEGHPAQVLAQTSQDADLLVVGARGRGAAGWLLGSVSREVAQRAKCSVAVVRCAETH